MKLSTFAITAFLTGMFAVSLITFTSKAPAQTRKETFPLIEGVTLGKVEYASFAAQPEQSIKTAISSQIRKEYPELNFGEWSPITYSYVKKDLNGDGRADALVYINNSIGSGSGGLHVWVFQANSNGYQIVGKFLHTRALVITPTRTFGWNDILVVPGKINRYSDIFYTLCKFDPNKPIEIKNRYLSSSKYGDCRKIQINSVISGFVIISNSAGQKPAFLLDLSVN
jgi:hypothetical protein